MCVAAQEGGGRRLRRIKRRAVKKFEASHPAVCGQPFIVLVPSLHNI